MVEDLLWRAIRNNDLEAFTEMYKSYYQFLFAYGMRVNGDKHLVKDSIHELFLEVWKGRATLPEVAHIGSYLRTILRRKIIKAVPQHQWRSLEEDSGGPEAVEYSYEERLVSLQSDEEMKQKVQKAIHSLSKKQLEVIRMKFFDEKSYAEIAEFTATTPRTVYNQVYEALKILRKYLGLLF